MTTDIRMMSDTLVRRSQQQHHKDQVSWSRQGHIAYSTPIKTSDNINNLSMTYLECVDGKTWQLAPPTGFRIPSFDKPLLNNRRKTFHDEQASSNTFETEKLPQLTNVEFSNTGWDLFTSDVYGHVSILVTGIKKTVVSANGAQPLTMGNSNSNNIPSQSPQQPQTNLMTQYSRTSFNSAELLYSDNSSLPLPDLSSHTKKESNQIIAFKWLNIDKPVIANSPAFKVQAGPESQVLNGCASKLGAAFQDASGFYYSYNAHQYKSYGAMHPLSTKQACIGLRKSGEVCLWHQEDHGIEYKKVTNNLSLGANDFVLDASIGFKRDGIVIIAAYSPGSRSVQFFEILIDWGYLLEASKNLPKIPTYRVPDDQRFAPKLTVNRLFRLNIDDVDSCCSKFTSVNLISPNYHQSTEFEVLMTFENDRSGSVSGINDKFNQPQSTLIRFQMEELDQSESIHSAFKNIAAKRGIDTNSTDKKMVSKLTFKQKLTFNESILGIEPLNLDMMLSISFANGMVKAFNRSNLQLIENIYNKEDSLVKKPDQQDVLLPSTINSLFDAGFEFPQMNFQPEYVCISPNICCYVALPINGSQLYIRSAELVIDKKNMPPNKRGLLLAITAAIALRHTSSCYFGYSTDDLIASIRCELERTAKDISESYSYRLLISILQECQRAINLTIDISTEQTDKMLQNQPLQRILTLQLSLGTNSNWKRNKSGQIAWALVNLKFVTSSIMYTIHTIYSNMQRFARKGLNTRDTLANARAREESIISVLGIIRWCMDYITCLNQELLELNTAFKNGDRDEIEKLINGSVVVSLILGKVPRAFLIFAISNIRRLFSFVQKFVEKDDPILTSLITPENQMGAFEVIERQMLLVDSPTTISKSSGGNGGSNGNGSSSNSASGNAGRALVTHPTLEAYYRLGAILNNSPVSLHVFEKFLVEADVPLRNMRLDQATSLAIEQQIVCQGHISKTFFEPLKKLCDVYDKSVLISGKVDVTELYFKNVDWLKLSIHGGEDENENENNRDASGGVKKEQPVQIKQEPGEDCKGDENEGNVEMYPSSTSILNFTDYETFRTCNKKLIESNTQDGLIIDTLRKQLLKPSDFVSVIDLNGTAGKGNTPGLIAKNNTHIRTDSMGMGGVNESNGVKLAMRKCIRCGAISSINETGGISGSGSTVENGSNGGLASATFVSNPVFQHYQRICFCGGAWANM